MRLDLPPAREATQRVEDLNVENVRSSRGFGVMKDVTLGDLRLWKAEEKASDRGRVDDAQLASR